ncbi:MAG: hypothetical protein PHO67_07765 [Candidatus Omnitrophica bacterium]|nr:hypothetical protein [Candidatus Omnitrophota bacterium]
MSKTITISDEAAAFLVELNRRLKTQDNRATRAPYYFTVRCVHEEPVPDGFTDEIRYVHDGTPFTEEELRKYCEDNDLDFEQFKENSCRAYCVRDVEEFKNFFFTEEGYNEHMKLNGHNYRYCKEVNSYVDHAFRNPEIEQLLSAIKEIGKALV